MKVLAGFVASALAAPAPVIIGGFLLCMIFA